MEILLSAGEKGAQPKTVIYTIGVWANGDSKCALVDETTPPAPIQAVAHRPAVEALVLGSSITKGIVIRPGLVYGGRGGLTGMWFQGALKDKSVKVIGDGNNHLPPIHVEDLADSYLRAAESGLGGELFLLADDSTATAKQMATAAARAAGYQGEVQLWPVADAAKIMGVWVEGLGLDQHIDSGKSRRLLGWQPRHRQFAEEAATYFEAWKEHQSASAICGLPGRLVRGCAYWAPRAGFPRMFTRWIGVGSRWLLEKIVAAITATGINPNVLTLFGLIVNFWAAVLFATGMFRSAAAVIFFAGFLDMLDGQVARRAKRVTAFGAFFDSTLDRYSDMALYMGLLVYYAVNGRSAYVILAAVATAGSVMVSYSRARAESPSSLPAKLALWSAPSALCC